MVRLRTLIEPTIGGDNGHWAIATLAQAQKKPRNLMVSGAQPFVTVRLRLHLFKKLLHAVEETSLLRRVAVTIAAIEAFLQLAKQVFLLVV